VDRRSLVLIAALLSLVPLTFGAATLPYFSAPRPYVVMAPVTVRTLAPPVPTPMPLERSMAKMDATNQAIKRILRNAATFGAGRDQLNQLAWELTDQNTSIRDETQAIADRDRTREEWTDEVDAFDEEAQRFSRLMLQPDTTYEGALAAYKQVTARCSACHVVLHPAAEK